MINHETSVDEGADYVRRLLRGQLDSYRGQPGNVTGDHSHERSAAEIYRGRQVLELLQNADDAGADYDGERRILFRLSERHFVVANTGVPFSTRGIRSLVVSEASPKRLARTRFIGNKGLGFRSVLTWSPAPLVLSGGFKVAFSPDHAALLAEELASELPELRSDFDDYQRSLGYLPVSTLRFPYVPEESDERLEIAEAVRAEGYDTVIVLPLSDGTRGEEIRVEITGQLSAVGSETVLFCRRLSQVRVEMIAEARTWHLDREDQTDRQFVAIDGGAGPDLWTVHRRSGTLPDELLDEESAKTPGYEVAVAVPERVERRGVHHLCVYFATEDELPMAMLAHATLATDPSRKRITAHPANRYILARLAELAADVAEAEAAGADPQRGLNLLAGAERCDRELERLGFLETLLTACRQRRLLPRVDGGIGTTKDVRAVPHRVWAELATPETFPEMLPTLEEAAARFAGAMGIFSYDSRTLAQRLERRVSAMVPAQAGNLVGRLAAARALPSSPPPAVLIGEHGNLLPADHTVFLPAERGRAPLPEWVERFDFLDAAFAEALRAALGAGRVRDTRLRLVEAGWQVEEFRLEGVARHLLAEAARHCTLTPQAAPQLRRELLSCLYDLAGQEDTADLSRIPVEVVTTRGRLRRADACYLGPVYPGGALAHALYAPLGKDEFVASPTELGISADAAAVEQFLRRLGVRAAPRDVQFTSPYGGERTRSYLREVLAGVRPYPTRAFGEEFRSPAEADQKLRVAFDDLSMPDRWEAVLEKSPSEAIIAYLLSDGRSHLDPGPVAGATLTATKGFERKPRVYPGIPVPNPAHYLLRTVPWVVCDDGVRRTPDRIILARSGRRALSGAYAGHGLELDHTLLRGRGGPPVAEGVLRTTGALQSFESLSADELYRLLLELPSRDPTGADAARIYRALAEHAEMDVESVLRDQFVREGRMWGTRNGVGGYHAVERLRYAPKASLPVPVRARIPLVAVDPRRGARTVERIFGVRALGDDDYSITLDPARTHARSWSDEAARRLRRAVPYLYAYRLSRTLDETGRERNALKAAQLRVCERISLEVEVLAEREPVALERELEGLPIRSDGLLLLVGPPSYPEHDPVFWRAVGDLLADAVEVAGAASEFAQLLGCHDDVQLSRLLDLMTDGEGEARLAEAITRLGFPDENPEPQAAIVELPDPAPEAAPAPGMSAPAHAPATESVDTRSGNDETGQDDDSSPDSIRRSTFHPADAPERRSSSRRRLVITPRSGRPSAPAVRADEDTSLELVMHYETLQNRFPMRVEHIHGSESLGCDVISFSSSCARSEVERARIADTNLVERFIEVKGRADRTSSVELEVNQRKAAGLFRERFYLYRVYRGPTPDETQLAILQNPVGSPAEMTRVHYHYDLRQGAGADWFDLVEEDAAPAQS